MPEEPEVHSRSGSLEVGAMGQREHGAELERYPGPCQGGSSGREAGPQIVSRGRAGPSEPPAGYRRARDSSQATEGLSDRLGPRKRPALLPISCEQ